MWIFVILTKKLNKLYNRKYTGRLIPDQEG
jgi:hypothetical protein